ncbi:MAG TPA: DNA-directed RNA polymerase subunit omega [Blastocatellia bacterium]|jgi:DNA-directed RNA polymerase subunit omega|nr:DNA-directed RNA polymerase subunit omega [Blastocatellia bacterium]
MPELDTEDWTTEVDSKYRLVLLAAKRCKQLQRGAKPRVNNATKKNTQVALEEVRRGLVQYQPIVKRSE